MRILIGDDDPALRTVLGSILTKWGYEVISARDGNEAWEALQAPEAPQLAILDWLMPGLNGPDICRKVRSERGEPYIYVILLTAQKRDEDVVAGLESGADDYIIKPYKINELRVRLRAGRRIIELQNELIAARETYQEKATHDSLTGLWNHGEILDILRHEVARMVREGKCISAIMADLDYFKRVNDTYGHMSGDTVLRETAQKIRTQVRSYDFVGRYGGEEFLLILPECNEECSRAFAERIRASVSKSVIQTPEGAIPVTLSLGVALSCKERRLDAEALIQASDKALYRAKGSGRNRVEIG